MKKYEINEKNFLAHELNGLELEVKNSSNKNRKGLKGKIVKETKNVFVIEKKGEEKIIPKKECDLRIKLPNGKKVEINGKKLAFRPEERIKKFWRKKNF